jgi:hypothetical protein
VQLACAIISNLAQHSDSTAKLIDIRTHEKMALIVKNRSYLDVNPRGPKAHHQIIHASAITALANLANTRIAIAHREFIRLDLAKVRRV